MAKRARKTVEVPADETKSQKFVRIGAPRVGRALSAISAISNLATSSYEHTPQQVKKIMSDLRASVDTIEAAFANGGPAKSKDSYTL